MRNFLTVGIISALILMTPLAAQAAVTFDAVGPSSAGTSCTRCTSLSWSHVMGSINNALLVVVVTDGTDGDTLSVTANGTAMTSAAKVHSNNTTSGFVQMFYLVGPSSGTNSISVTGITKNSNGVTGGSVSFMGVDQTTPLAHVTTNAGTGSPASVTVTSASGDMVVDGVANGSSITSSSQTNRWLKNLNGNSAAGNGAQSTAAGASSVTMSYTVTSDFFGIIGADVVAAGGGGGASAPTVSTNSAETFTPDTATLFGSITATGGADATQSGFAWSTSSTLSSGVSTTTLGSQTGTASFSSALSSLSANTTYYYRAYATNSGGTGYGSILNFTTGNSTPARKMRLFEGFKIKLISGTLKLYQQ